MNSLEENERADGTSCTERDGHQPDEGGAIAVERGLHGVDPAAPSSASVAPPLGSSTSGSSGSSECTAPRR